mmetsp:Transcript_42120/g.120133  ORF Transcript_42120/g.120133 Transcript_42120/m.120133 type:complete len:299 (-) Transcript_42120:120-1016(-)
MLCGHSQSSPSGPWTGLRRCCGAARHMPRRRGSLRATRWRQSGAPRTWRNPSLPCGLSAPSCHRTQGWNGSSASAFWTRSPLSCARSRPPRAIRRPLSTRGISPRGSSIRWALCSLRSCWPQSASAAPSPRMRQRGHCWNTTSAPPTRTRCLLATARNCCCPCYPRHAGSPATSPTSSCSLRRSTEPAQPWRAAWSLSLRIRTTSQTSGASRPTPGESPRALRGLEPSAPCSSAPSWGTGGTATPSWWPWTLSWSSCSGRWRTADGPGTRVSGAAWRATCSSSCLTLHACPASGALRS